MNVTKLTIYAICATLLNHLKAKQDKLRLYYYIEKNIMLHYLLSNNH